MANVYKPALVQIRPQYSSGQTDELTTPENVLWFQGAGTSYFPLTVSQLVLIQSTFDSAWALLWKIAGFTGYSYTGSVATDWSTSTGAQSNTVGSFTPVAGVATTRQAAQVSCLISMKTANAPKYRGGHGRMYLPFIGLPMNDAYTFMSTPIANIQAQWATFSASMAGIATVNGGGYQQMMYRERTNPTNAALYVVTSVTTQARAATQRRRLRKAPHH